MIFGEPYFAMNPMMSPPMTGMMITHESQLIFRRAAKMEGPDVVEREIGEKSDQVVEEKRNATRR